MLGSVEGSAACPAAARAVDLADGGGRAVQAVGPGELAVQAVETPVFLVDHDRVSDVGQAEFVEDCPWRGGLAFAPEAVLGPARGSGTIIKIGVA